MNKRPGFARKRAVFVLLTAALLLAVLLNIRMGSVEIAGADIFRILFMGQTDSSDAVIVREIRLPRIVMALLLGGALSVSGFLLQTFFRNPIAGPFILGISSGAKLAVALVMIVLISRFHRASSLVMIAAALAGALLATGFILLIARHLSHMAALLVAGIMVGYICSAITDFMITFAEDSDIVNLHGWSQGSFSGMTWGNAAVAAAVILPALVMVMFLAKPMGAFLQGEGFAKSVGVNVPRFRTALILLSGVLSATVTAFAGPISFVGIAVPYLMKRALSSAQPVLVIPASFLGGALLTLLCDLIARCAFAPTELNISTVTAIFGAPVVIWMMMTRNREGDV